MTSSSLMGSGQYQLGILYADTNRSDDAKNMFESYLNIARKSKDWTLELNSLRGLGYTYGQLNEWPDSLKFYEQALALTIIHQEDPDVVLAKKDILFSLAKGYMNTDELTLAGNYLEQSIPLISESKDYHSLGEAYYNLAIILEDLYYMNEAKKYYELACTIQSEIGDWDGFIRSSFNLGLLFAESDEQEAIHWFEKSFEAGKIVNDVLHLKKTSGGLALLYYQSNDFYSAQKYANINLPLSEQLGDQENAERMKLMIMSISLNYGTTY